MLSLRAPCLGLKSSNTAIDLGGRMKLSYVVCICFVLISALTLAQSNPVPFVNQPLVPMTAAPGGPSFTLTVNGAGFVSGATVNWNGAALATTFINKSQLTATVPAADIANAGTASVTVVNPKPGGGVSNVEFLVISDPISTMTFTPVAANPNVQSPFSPITADFNGDGKLDLAYFQLSSDLSVASLTIQLGNGDGTFQGRVSYACCSMTSYALGMVSGDFNGNGYPDLAVVAGGDVFILLNNGDGTFHFGPTFYSPVGGALSIAAGDFNGDGKLDLAIGTNTGVSLYLGNGDGTFQQQGGYATGLPVTYMVAGDFNRDGVLDLVVPTSGVEMLFLQGVGDGTFLAPYGPLQGPWGVDGLITADINGDSKLDLIAFPCASYINMLLGNGDGTFQPPVNIADLGTVVVVGDFNADGKLDLALIWTNGVNGDLEIFPGNGDGTFQSPTKTDIEGSGTFGLVAGDFNSDGKMDLAMTMGYPGDYNLLVFLQGQFASADFGPTSLNFGSQAIGTPSAPRDASLDNIGTSTLTLSNISITGANAGDFAQTNSCPASLAPGGNVFCDVSVTFTPTAAGSRSATLSFTDNALGSPQLVSLMGTGAIPVPPVLLSPSSVAFPAQYVGTSGLPQTVTLTNNGTATLAITSVAASPSDFGVLSACGSSVAVGNSWAIGVFFDPTTSGNRTGTLTLTDNAGDSPQTVALSGTGQDFSMAPSGSSSATVAPGQTASYTISISPGGNFNQTVTLSCNGAPALSTCTLSANSIVLNGSSATPVTVTVKTTGASASLARPAGFRRAGDRLALWLALPGLAGLVLMGTWNRKAGNWRGLRCVLALVCLLSLGIWSACGGTSSGSGGGGGTPPGNYSLVVTGTFTSGSTSLTHNTTLTLIVQPAGRN
jgi:hypothetical protein